MKLLETFNSLLESKASEGQGLKTLKNAKIEGSENIIQQFARADKSVHQKNIPVMAYIYASGYNDIASIIKTLNNYNDLEFKKRVKPIQLTKDGIVMGDKKFNDFDSFDKFIKIQRTRYPEYEENQEVNQTPQTPEVNQTSDETDEDYTPNYETLYSVNGIDIYEGDTIDKCIAYTQGGLTGRGYSFCIGQAGPQNLFTSYRDTQTSTFYFIVDTNRIKTNDDGTPNLDDPLHIVVLDNQKIKENGNEYRIQLTDANNTTGNIAKYGTDVNAYLNYLKSMGVPNVIKNKETGEELELFRNRGKSDQEEYENKLLGKTNHDLEWFINLPMDYKSKYIGRGHLLTNDQFDYLIGK